MLVNLKLVFPNGGQTEDEVKELLQLAMENRKRVKDQLARIDSTYPEVDFHFVTNDGRKHTVSTVEEEEFPQFYHLKPMLDEEEQEGSDAIAPAEAKPVKNTTQTPAAPIQPIEVGPEEGHKVYAENRKGVNYAKLFGPYLKGAAEITITDPYIRLFYQVRNVMELIEMVIQQKAPRIKSRYHHCSS